MTRVRDLSVTSVVIQDMFGCPAATLLMVVLAGDIHARLTLYWEQTV
jgi:hypothetical protein